MPNSTAPMNGENQPLVTYESADFEIQMVEVQDFKNITHPFRRIYGIYLKLVKRKT